ncbi:3-phenylpropionate MFS transporter [Oceanisphaera pacifica]|uniref:3-phenylpropionate MFS transporter n=1 Tax=Oceanisphaera pacifica TaxID=2818389 RepID=A0ABS3NF46_9GAMM|nr:3-phenylpropionate MFS transporter [Oceanisphaera pacifica]MBO1518911.1 3-phenylpropionate MFS transporter [Oceanisphaera pacifica]
MSPAIWLSALFALFYFSYGIYLPYWSLWLSHIEVEADVIGWLLGLGMVARCVGSLAVMSQLRSAHHLLPAIRLLAGLSVLIVAGFYLSQSLWALVILMLALNLIYPALMPVNEALASRLIQQVRLDYGKSRLWGSFAFIVANVAVGSLSNHWGAQWILHAMLMSLALMWLMSFSPMTPAPVEQHKERQGNSVLTVWRQPEMKRFLLVVSLLQGSHAFYYGFSALHWQSQGYATTTIGYLWGLGVLAEIAVLALNRRWFEGMSAQGLLLAGAAFALVRWGILGSTTELIWLVVAQLLHAGSFCLSHLGAMRYISRDLKPEAVIGAQALYGALALGLVVAVLLVASGKLYPTLGGQTFWLMAAIILPALVLLRRPLQGNAAETP